MLKKKPLHMATVKLQGAAAFGEGILPSDANAAIEIRKSKDVKNCYTAVYNNEPAALLPQELTPFLLIMENHGYGCYGNMNFEKPKELRIDIFATDKN